MVLVGPEYPPKIGLRVEKVGPLQSDLSTAFDFDFKRLVPPGMGGTIEEIAEDGMLCTVRWDNGDLQLCSSGGGPKGELAVFGSVKQSARQDFGHNQPIYGNSNGGIANQGSRSPQIYKAQAAPASATLGLRIYQGQRVDYVVPGGPAHLSQMLERNDEIIAVDGMEVYPETMQDAIIGDDVEGSVVTLTVRKQHTGNIFDVQLIRVSKKSLQSMVELLDILEHMKKPLGEELSMMDMHRTSKAAIVDRATSLISQIMLDR